MASSFNLQTLEAALSDLPLGGIRYIQSIPSTNDEAVAWAQAGAAEASLVIADQQTQGRGRPGHQWFTYPGTGLAFSLVLRPSGAEMVESPSLVSRFTGLGALGVSLALQKQYGLPAQIKWPNDVLIRERKVCGALAEAHWIGDQLSYIILGIGLNLTANALPPETSLHLPATSLELELGYPLERLKVLYHVLAEIMIWRPQVMQPAFLEAWEANLAYKGQVVRFSHSNQGGANDPGGLTGTLLGLDPAGGLRLHIQGENEVSLQYGSILKV